MNPALIPILLELVKSGKLDGILGDKASILKDLAGDSSRANLLGAISVIVDHAPPDDRSTDEYLRAVNDCISGLIALKQFHNK